MCASKPDLFNTEGTNETDISKNNAQAHIHLLHYPDITGDWCIVSIFFMS